MLDAAHFHPRACDVSDSVVQGERFSRRRGRNWLADLAVSATRTPRRKCLPSGGRALDRLPGADERKTGVAALPDDHRFDDRIVHVVRARPTDHEVGVGAARGVVALHHPQRDGVPRGEAARSAAPLWPRTTPDRRPSPLRDRVNGLAHRPRIAYALRIVLAVPEDGADRVKEVKQGQPLAPSGCD